MIFTAPARSAPQNAARPVLEYQSGFGNFQSIQTLLDYLEAGETIDAFLEGFPTVTREQVIAFLEEAKARMVATDA